MSFRNRVTVSLAALQHNIHAVQRLAGERSVIAVVKADAYGLGLERCARIYHDAGATMLAVASLGEADRTRKLVPQARILLLGQPLPHERPAVVGACYEVCCSCLEEAADFDRLGSASDRPVAVHVFVDTGMGRSGCAPDEAAELVAFVRQAPGLRLAGVASHYPDAQDPTVSAAQEACFSALLAELGPLPEGCLVHLANSEGLLCRPAVGNAVRVGLLLTGVVPRGCPTVDLVQALHWEAAVTLVKRLPAGHAVSYGCTYHMAAEGPVALVPVGYADGYPFAAGNRGVVAIGDCRCPVIGRVTMDYLVVDIGCCPEVKAGDPVQLLGDRITVVEFAELVDTIAYDVLCGLRGRCEVVSVADHGPAGEPARRGTVGRSAPRH